MVLKNILCCTFRKRQSDYDDANSFTREQYQLNTNNRTTCNCYYNNGGTKQFRSICHYTVIDK